VAGLLLAWVAAFIVSFRPNMRHTFGWQKASITAAFINATLLLIAKGSLIL
jgi:cobalt-zinc-cadmium efflux system protein